MNHLKEKAIQLRSHGYSYQMIRDDLGVSKSTLSDWLSRVPFIPNEEVVRRVGEARLKSARFKHRLKFENIENMRKEAAGDIGTLSARDIFMLGIGLYLGEGSKSQEEVRMVNSDPAVIKIMLRWFRDFCGVQSHHIRVAVHGYPDNDAKELVNFWSGAIDIPREQFIKTSIDTRQNKSPNRKRKLPYGTAHVYIRGGGTLPLGVKSLHRKIMGWIESSANQI